MRISDWSSDVCSSDLTERAPCQCVVARRRKHFLRAAYLLEPDDDRLEAQDSARGRQRINAAWKFVRLDVVEDEIGRAPAVVERVEERSRDPALRQIDEREHRAVSTQRKIGRATSELQSLMRSSYAVFCLKKKNKH